MFTEAEIKQFRLNNDLILLLFKYKQNIFSFALTLPDQG